MNAVTKKAATAALAADSLVPEGQAKAADRTVLPCSAVLSFNSDSEFWVLCRKQAAVINMPSNSG